MRSRLLGFVGFSILVAACGGGGGDTTPTPPVVPASVATTTVTIANASLTPGQNTQLTVVTRDASGNVLTGRSVSYTSSNTGVATVSSSGLVNAVAAGSTTLTATSEGKSGSAALTVALVPVSTVTITLASNAVLSGQTAQLTVSVRDAAGASLTGRTVSYTSSSPAVAAVNASGLITTLTPGTSTITATVDDKSGSLLLTSVNPRVIPVFDKPFPGEFPVGNFFDHDIPKEFVDVNNTFMPFWGEAHPGLGLMVDGHSGYDFLMPTGTPMLAVAAGTVVIASASSAPFFCPPLNRNVTDQADVYIEHKLPGGITVQSRYSHLSRVDVTVGQLVTAGQQIALSGNSGCTTTPHLHFEVDRMNGTATGQRTEIDPYGWTGGGTDPWEVSPIGAMSIQLWKSGQAPQIYREITNSPPATAASPLLLSRIVFQGVNDATNPNNEFVDITLDSRVTASTTLNGWSLRGDFSGLNFAFPAGITLNTAQPTLRVYTGSGTNNASTLYLGRSSGIWNNLRADCARLVSPAGGQIRVTLGTPCPL